VKDVLRRSLHRSLLVASPAVLNSTQAAAVTPSSVSTTSQNHGSATADADNAARKPLRSILHSCETNICDAVESVQLHETSGGGKRRMTRYDSTEALLIW